MSPVPPDKALHALAGAAMFLAGRRIVGPLTGAALCVGAGAAKEMWDGTSRLGTASRADFYATVAGGALAALVALPFMREAPRPVRRRLLLPFRSDSRRSGEPEGAVQAPPALTEPRCQAGG